MTLKRKSLIRSRTHFLWYSLALVLSLLYILKAKGIIFFVSVIALFALKVKFDMNKYLMWGLFTLAVYGLEAYGSSAIAGFTGTAAGVAEL
jgi:hypothetical protein